MTPTPTRQLLAKWIVMAWERIPESLVRKAWTVCGYKEMKDLEEEAASKELVQYTSQELGSLVENLAGADAMMAWIDEANDPEEFSDDDDDDSVEGKSRRKEVEMSDEEDPSDDDASGEKDSSDEEDIYAKYLESSSESEDDDEEPRGRAACLRNGKRRKVKPSGQSF